MLSVGRLREGRDFMQRGTPWPANCQTMTEDIERLRCSGEISDQGASEAHERTRQMEATIKCGKHFAEHADLSGSQFHDVNLAGADFDDVNLSKARFHNINLSDIQVSAVQIGGATFKHVGPPPNDKQAVQRPVTFEEATLCGSTFRKVDMSNVKIIECNIQGMTVDGILISDLLQEHRKRNG